MTPHEAGSRGVPWPSCGCATCDTAREDAETRADRDHQAKIADLVGLTDDDL